MAKYQKIIIGAPPMNFGGTEVRDAFVLINHAIEGLEEVTAKVENAGGIPGNSDNNFTDDLKAKLEALPTADELSKTTVTEAEKAVVCFACFNFYNISFGRKRYGAGKQKYIA